MCKKKKKNFKAQILLYRANTNHVLLGTVMLRSLQNILLDKASPVAELSILENRKSRENIL